MAEGIIQLTASDLVGHLNCGYLTNLDLAVAKGELGKPFVWDPLVEVLAERGAAMAISRMPSGSQSHREATQIIRKSVIDIVLRKTPNGSDRADSLYGVPGIQGDPLQGSKWAVSLG